MRGLYLNWGKVLGRSNSPRGPRLPPDPLSGERKYFGCLKNWPAQRFSFFAKLDKPSLVFEDLLLVGLLNQAGRARKLMKFRERLVPWSQDPRLRTKEKEKLRNRSALKRMKEKEKLRNRSALKRMTRICRRWFVSFLRRFDVDWHDLAHCQMEKAEFAGRHAAQPSYFVNTYSSGPGLTLTVVRFGDF